MSPCQWGSERTRRHHRTVPMRPVVGEAKQSLSILTKRSTFLIMKTTEISSTKYSTKKTTKYTCKHANKCAKPWKIGRDPDTSSRVWDSTRRYSSSTHRGRTMSAVDWFRIRSEQSAADLPYSLFISFSLLLKNGDRFYQKVYLNLSRQTFI